MDDKQSLHKSTVHHCRATVFIVTHIFYTCYAAHMLLGMCSIVCANTVQLMLTNTRSHISKGNIGDKNVFCGFCQ